MTAIKPLVAAMLLLAAAHTQANVQITEWMYSGPGDEFTEFTDLGSTSVSFVGWVYSDVARAATVGAGGFGLSALGTVAPGQSVVLTKSTVASFRANWGLTASIKVVGGTTPNIGRSDEINLFSASGTLFDRFTYSDVNFAGTVRTQDRSGTPSSLADLASSTVTTGWVLSAVGNAYGFYTALGNVIGNHGVFALAVPEATTHALWLAGPADVGAIARRR